MSALLAGLPIEVGGTTINRLCGSGLDAVIYAARAIAVGEGDIYIAGGTESMTRAPFVMAKPEIALSTWIDMELQDTTIGWRFTNKKLRKMYGADTMPKTAENVAQRFQYHTGSTRSICFRKPATERKKQWKKIALQNEIVPVIC